MKYRRDHVRGNRWPKNGYFRIHNIAIRQTKENTMAVKYAILFNIIIPVTKIDTGIPRCGAAATSYGRKKLLPLMICVRLIHSPPSVS
jgi:hypothetical protein